MDRLEVRGLTVRVAGRAVVDDVSLDVGRGEIVAVIGPNGAGKTTLLEAVVGVRPAPSCVFSSGKPLRSFGERAATFAYAPDEARPPGEATVGTLLAHAEARGPRAVAVRDEVRRALHLEAWAERSAGALSRGEQKRVLLYLALATDRPFVVLDEPFGAFDPLQLRDVLRAVRLVADAGAGVLVSVHQLEVAERVADRVLLLAGGKRVAFGTPEEIRREAGGAATLEEAFVTLLSGRAEGRG